MMYSAILLVGMASTFGGCCKKNKCCEPACAPACSTCSTCSTCAAPAPACNTCAAPACSTCATDCCVSKKCCKKWKKCKKSCCDTCSTCATSTCATGACVVTWQRRGFNTWVAVYEPVSTRDLAGFSASDLKPAPLAPVSYVSAN